MPHAPGLAVQEPSERAQQSARYDNLAAFAHKVLTINGQPRYSEASLRRQLAAGRVLAKDGTPHTERLNKFMRSLGAKNFKMDEQAWGRVAEGESPRA